MQTGISRNIPTCTCIMIVNGILSKTVNVVHNQLETRMTDYTLQIKTIKSQLVYTVVVRGGSHKSLEFNPLCAVCSECDQHILSLGYYLFYELKN